MNQKFSKRGHLDDPEWVELVDRAARGDLDAMVDLAKGYYLGSYGEKNVGKAVKWCGYAAKKGNERALRWMETLEEPQEERKRRQP